MEKRKDIIGILFSTISWWICVLGGKYLSPQIQLFSFGAFILLTFFLHFSLFVEFPKPFIFFYVVSVLFGLLGDGLLFAFSQFSFVGPKLGLFPYWLLTLWLIFPFNFLHTFKKFAEKPKLGIPFGIIGGPLAYAAGPKFQILELGNYSLIFVGVFWGVYMLYVHWMTRKFPI